MRRRRLLMVVLLLLLLPMVPIWAQEPEQELDEYLMGPKSELEEDVKEEVLVVPHLLFLEDFKADEILRRLGFSNVRRIKIPTETRSGIVLYVVPPAGKPAKPEERITVFISKQRKDIAAQENQRKKAPAPPAVTKSAAFGLPYWFLLQFLLFYIWYRVATRIDLDRETGQLLFIRLPSGGPAEPDTDKG